MLVLRRREASSTRGSLVAHTPKVTAFGWELGDAGSFIALDITFLLIGAMME
jgi:hypothetical protein